MINNIFLILLFLLNFNFTMCASESNKEVNKTEQVDNMCFSEAVYDEGNRLIFDITEETYSCFDECVFYATLDNENVENVSFEIVCFENIDNYSLNYISEKLVEVTFKTNDCENHFIEIMCSYLHNGEVQQYSKNIFIYTHLQRNYVSDVTLHDAKFKAYVDASNTENPSYEEYYDYFFDDSVDSSISVIDNYSTSNASVNIYNTITINGTIQWKDFFGVEHPAKNVRVAAIEDDILFFQGELGYTYTNSNGYYSMTIPCDELFEYETVDIKMQISAQGGNIKVVNNLNAVYKCESDVYKNFSDSILPYSYTIDVNNFLEEDKDIPNSFKVHQAAEFGAGYVEFLDGARLPEMKICYPSAGNETNFVGTKINIGYGNTNDWDLILHEYAHYVQLEYDITSGVSGEHNIYECIAEYNSNGKELGAKIAWIEGWATYFSVSSQEHMNASAMNIEFVGDSCFTNLREDTTNDREYHFDLETIYPNVVEHGETNEMNNAAVLFDLADGINTEENDNVSLGFQYVWDKITEYQCDTLDKAMDVLYAIKHNDMDLKFGEILNNNGVSSTLVSPAANSILSTSSPLFTWSATGGSNLYPNNQFNLVIFDNNYNIIYRSASLTTTQKLLSQTEWIDVITSTTNYIYWAVECYQTTEYTTGFYYSNYRKVYVPTIYNAQIGNFDNNCSAEQTIKLYRFTAPSNNTYRFYTTGEADTYARLYGDTSNGLFGLLASNDESSSSNYNFSITRYLAQGQVVYILVGDDDEEESFDYSLYVEIV